MANYDYNLAVNLIIYLMKKSLTPSRASPRPSPRPSTPTKSAVSETDMFAYNGPVQWTTKNISPYRGINVKSQVNLNKPAVD